MFSACDYDFFYRIMISNFRVGILFPMNTNCFSDKNFRQLILV